MHNAHRKLLHRREQASTWRFLTCSCNHRLPFFEDDWVKELFVDCLAAAQQRRGFRLLAWVLMPEHFHLMLAPNSEPGVPGSTVPSILHNLKTPIAQSVLARWRKSDSPWLQHVDVVDGSKRFWLPGGGFDRNVRDLDELRREVRYIHHNPVKRGLVAQPTDWKWSSARWWAGLADDRVRIDTTSQTRDWAL